MVLELVFSNGKKTFKSSNHLDLSYFYRQSLIELEISFLWNIFSTSSEIKEDDSRSKQLSRKNKSSNGILNDTKNSIGCASTVSYIYIHR